MGKIKQQQPYHAPQQENPHVDQPAPRDSRPISVQKLDNTQLIWHEGLVPQLVQLLHNPTRGLHQNRLLVDEGIKPILTLVTTHPTIAHPSEGLTLSNQLRQIIIDDHAPTGRIFQKVVPDGLLRGVDVHS